MHCLTGFNKESAIKKEGNQVGVIAQELLNTPHKWMVYTGTEENKSNKKNLL